MRSSSCKIFVVGFLMVAAVAWSSAYGQKPKKGADPAARIQKKLDKAGLSAEESEKAKKVIAEHAPKLKEAQGKADDVLTSEQRAAQKQVMKDAKASGKKRKELQAEIEKKLKLTDEQKAKLASAKKELATVQSELNTALGKVLTKDQLAAAGIKTRKKKNG